MSNDRQYNGSAVVALFGVGFLIGIALILSIHAALNGGA